jgi:hypothetical protein
MVGTTLLVAATCGTAQPPAEPTTVGPTAGVWKKLAPLPTPRTEIAVAEASGFIYVVGGFEADGSVSRRVEVYDPREDTWSEAPPLPQPRHHATAYGGAYLIVAGGYIGQSKKPTASVLRYDPGNEAWTELSPLAEARGAAGIAGSYVAGGIGEEGASLNSTEHYLSGTWESAGSLRAPRDHLAVATAPFCYGDDCRTRVYAIGGRRHGNVERNLDANEWTEHGVWRLAARMPTARSGLTAAGTGGCGTCEFDPRVFALGGEGPDHTFDANEVYDPYRDSWSTAAPMPTARHGLGAVFYHEVIYVIGGGPNPGLSVSDANEAYTPGPWEPPQ